MCSTTSTTHADGPSNRSHLPLEARKVSLDSAEYLVGRTQMTRRRLDCSPSRGARRLSVAAKRLAIHHPATGNDLHEPLACCGARQPCCKDGMAAFAVAWVRVWLLRGEGEGSASSSGCYTRSSRGDDGCVRGNARKIHDGCYRILLQPACCASNATSSNVQMLNTCRPQGI